MTPQDTMKTSNAHLKRVERYVSLLSALFNKSDSRLASLAAQADYDPERDGQFFFEDYPDLMKEAKKIVNELALGVENIIGRGTSAEWAKANEKADGIVSGLLKTLGVKKEDLTDDAISKYFNNHEAACLAFEKRVQKGMNLSSKVWNLAEHRRLELQLGVSIARGNSSDEIALNIQKFLKEPDKLFRRVRDEFGILRLSKNAKAYTPEPGAYRSSYKNALRLARTEINMAYRSAEQERYNDFDFVVGFEVKRSTNPYPCPTCESLAGKYPKDFVFTGWHPNCRCFIVPILISEEEMDKRRAAILNGEDYDCSDSENYVKDVPDAFTEWISTNTERLKDSVKNGTLPYFLEDNKWAWGDTYISISTDNDVVASAGKVISSKLERSSFVLDGHGYTDEEYCRKFRSALYTVYGGVGGKGVREAFGPALDLMKKGDWSKASEFFRNNTPTPYLRQLEMLNKISEVNKMYKKVSKMNLPDEWMKELTRCVSHINASRKGYLFREFSNVESAYNICKLATNDDVIRYGLKNVSMRMPYNLISTFKKQGCHILLDDVEKSFFDKFKEFVPLETRWNNVYKTKFDVNATAFYWQSGGAKMVVIPIETNLVTLKRIRNNSDIQRMVHVYHEYGHAFDYASVLGSFGGEFRSFYNKWYGISDAEYLRMKDAFDKNIRGLLTDDTREDAIAFSDIIQALRVDADNSMIYGGHGDGYYKDGLKRPVELFANGTSAKYLGNPFLKLLYPDLYDELIKVMEKMYGAS